MKGAFRNADLLVFSNSKNYRCDPHVPFVVPLINTLSNSPLKKGFILTNANCSTTGLVIPLRALEKTVGPIESCIVTTMQAISGAAYPGVPNLGILDNVVPLISGKEEEMEWETLKILRNLVDGGR